MIARSIAETTVGRSGERSPEIDPKKKSTSLDTPGQEVYCVRRARQNIK